MNRITAMEITLFGIFFGPEYVHYSPIDRCIMASVVTIVYWDILKED